MGEFTYDRLVAIFNALVNMAIQFGTLAATAAIVWFGVRMVMSQGDPAAYGQAKKGLGWAVVGAIVIFGVYTIIATVRGGVESLGN